MSLISYADSAISILPPLLAIILAILTRQVILSLGVGILSGALLLTDFAPIEAVKYALGNFTSLFWADGGLNLDKLYILAFLIMLGMITALISVSGATAAFAEWARKKIRNKREANLLTMALGVVIFIDDYFNSLVVGSVARPITDRYYISRAKLAYLLDSTAAPICVISPISSWGAYIIALIGGILVSHGVTEYSQLSAFVMMIPMNFYAIFALILLLAVAIWGIDIGPMRREEQQALRGYLFDEAKGTPPGATEVLPEREGGKLSGLFVPIISLVLATFFFMVESGASSLTEQGKAFSMLGAFENTNVGYSLFFGALTGLLITIIITVSQSVSASGIKSALLAGVKSMLPAVYILLFAWTISMVIGNLETGKYMASLAQGNIPVELLPAMVFILAALAAFSTGTSWGTFGIMLPIAADMAAGTNISLIMPMLAAVLAGAVFGDHCSPISDTTILSSTGANCHHIDHVVTQLPYALIVAVISIIGYVVLGFTQSIELAFSSSLILTLLTIVVLKHKTRI